MIDKEIKDELLRRLKGIYNEGFTYTQGLKDRDDTHHHSVEINSRTVSIRFEFYGMSMNCGGGIVEGLYIYDNKINLKSSKRAIREVCWFIDCLASFNGRYGLYYTIALDDDDDGCPQEFICKELVKYGWKRVKYKWMNHNSDNMITTLIRQIPNYFYDNELNDIIESTKKQD